MLTTSPPGACSRPSVVHRGAATCSGARTSSSSRSSTSLLLARACPGRRYGFPSGGLRRCVRFGIRRRAPAAPGAHRSSRGCPDGRHPHDLQRRQGPQRARIQFPACHRSDPPLSAVVRGERDRVCEEIGKDCLEGRHRTPAERSHSLGQGRDRSGPALEALRLMFPKIARGPTGLAAIVGAALSGLQRRRCPHLSCCSQVAVRAKPATPRPRLSLQPLQARRQPPR